MQDSIYGPGDTEPEAESRFPAELLSRFAERRFPGSSPQEPPRNTRPEHSPDIHALPSDGAPE